MEYFLLLYLYFYIIKLSENLFYYCQKSVCTVLVYLKSANFSIELQKQLLYILFTQELKISIVNFTLPDVHLCFKLVRALLHRWLFIGKLCLLSAASFYCDSWCANVLLMLRPCLWHSCISLRCQRWMSMWGVTEVGCCQSPPGFMLTCWLKNWREFELPTTTATIMESAMTGITHAHS